MKDPAFLFYSNDFYEGTRLMLPEERACFIDLLIYQHQHGYIPNDLKRVKQYCAGIEEATLKATLEAKFKLCDEGWYNQKLLDVVDSRKKYTDKQSENGRVGQIMKKAKSSLTAKEYKHFKDYFYSVLGKEEALKKLDSKEATLKGLLKASLKHYEDEDENRDEDKDETNNDKPTKKENVVYPFDTEKFKRYWGLWLDYKSKEFNFKYKSEQSEQAALKKLANYSQNNESKAIQIIEESMANGWKGFFEIKNEKNGKGQSNFEKFHNEHKNNPIYQNL